MFRTCSSVPVVNLEHVIAGWGYNTTSIVMVLEILYWRIVQLHVYYKRFFARKAIFINTTTGQLPYFLQ